MFLLRERNHIIIRIGGNRGRIIRTNRDNRIALRRELSIKIHDSLFVLFRIGAVIASKDYDKSFCIWKIGEGHKMAIDIFQLKIRCAVADLIATRRACNEAHYNITGEEYRNKEC